MSSFDQRRGEDDPSTAAADALTTSSPSTAAAGASPAQPSGGASAHDASTTPPLVRAQSSSAYIAGGGRDSGEVAGAETSPAQSVSSSPAQSPAPHKRAALAANTLDDGEYPMEAAKEATGVPMPPRGPTPLVPMPNNAVVSSSGVHSRSASYGACVRSPRLGGGRASSSPTPGGTAGRGLGGSASAPHGNAGAGADNNHDDKEAMEEEFFGKVGLQVSIVWAALFVGGFCLLAVAQSVMVSLKADDVVDWSWDATLTPLWIGASVAMLTGVGLLLARCCDSDGDSADELDDAADAAGGNSDECPCDFGVLNAKRYSANTAAGGVGGAASVPQTPATPSDVRRQRILAQMERDRQQRAAARPTPPTFQGRTACERKVKAADNIRQFATMAMLLTGAVAAILYGRLADHPDSYSIFVPSGILAAGEVALAATRVYRTCRFGVASILLSDEGVREASDAVLAFVAVSSVVAPLVRVAFYFVLGVQLQALMPPHRHPDLQHTPMHWVIVTLPLVLLCILAVTASFVMNSVKLRNGSSTMKDAMFSIGLSICVVFSVLFTVIATALRLQGVTEWPYGACFLPVTLMCAIVLCFTCCFGCFVANRSVEVPEQHDGGQEGDARGIEMNAEGSGPGSFHGMLGGSMQDGYGSAAGEYDTATGYAVGPSAYGYSSASSYPPSHTHHHPHHQQQHQYSQQYQPQGYPHHEAMVFNRSPQQQQYDNHHQSYAAQHSSPCPADHHVQHSGGGRSDAVASSERHDAPPRLGTADGVVVVATSAATQR